jgi:hypothetical protein
MSGIANIAGPFAVEFLTSVASETFAFKAGDRIGVNKFYRDAWTASGICRAVDSIDDPEALKRQIAELQERLANAGKKK